MVLTQPKKGVIRNLEGLLERERSCEEKEILSSGREHRWNMSSAGSDFRFKASCLAR